MIAESDRSEQPRHISDFKFVQTVHDLVGITQGCGRVCCRDADDFHFRRVRGFDPDVRILKDDAPICLATQPLGAQQKNFGIRFAVCHVGSRNDLLEIPAQADEFNYQLDIFTRRGRADDARDAGGVQPLQEFLDARQRTDAGLTDDLPVKFLFLPRHPFDFGRVGGPMEELRDDPLVFHPKTALEMTGRQQEFFVLRQPVPTQFVLPGRIDDHTVPIKYGGPWLHARYSYRARFAHATQLY